MRKEFKIYQANAGRGLETHHSIMNAEYLKDFALLLIQEPHMFEDEEKAWQVGPRRHMYWNPLLPEPDAENSRPRAMIWAHKDVVARPVKTHSTDLTAALVEVGRREILVISVYIPPKISRTDRELHESLLLINKIVTETRRTQREKIELIIAGDFNRHDQLWGGDHIVNTDRQGEAEEIIQLMADLDLQSPVPRGITTWQSRSDAKESTIDLMLVTPELMSEVQYCNIDETQHGSDHNAIRTEITIDWESPITTQRKLWKKARWSLIRREVENSLQATPEPQVHNDIDQYCDFIMDMVLPAVEKHVPVANPSPYTKRWWDEDLTRLRADYTFWRNKARAGRRAGLDDNYTRQMAQSYRKRFHDAVRNQKKTHWLDFIADADNIWKVAKCMDPNQGTSFAKIPVIKASGTRLLTKNASIAQELLKEFFPQPPQVTETFQEAQQQDELPMEPISEEEVRKAIFTANPYKAPGSDGLPAVVWQQLWEVLKGHIVALFQLSIQTGKLPERWKTAKIVPLRKGGTRDWTKAKSYRPISLLATLGKALEAVIAERLAYYAETYHLLPNNHFGARKVRSATQALCILQESAFQAWRDHKVLSLVSFDVRGAFNGVDVEVLTKRLRHRGIPSLIVNWIKDFCTGRKASVTVNGETTQLTNLPQSGLPQGSRVSPISFLFFNADLVSSKLNRNEGAIAFVDDYTAWVVGESSEENTRKLQRTIVERAERWARASGASFEAEKTAFVHLTRNSSKLSTAPLTIDGKEVVPQGEVKILGVLVDQQLRFKGHLARIGKRGLKAALELKRIKGLSPRTARTLFTAKVTPVIDYASPIWSPGTAYRTTKIVNQAQRIGAQAIIGAFRTVGLERAEAEADISPSRVRWELQMGKFWVKCHTLPEKHPFWRWQRQLDIRNRRFRSPLQRIAKKFEKVQLSDLETIEPYCLAPWRAGFHVTVQDKEEAVKWANETSERVLYVDASYRKGNIGTGIYFGLGNCQHRIDDRQSLRIGHSEQVTANHTELVAIYQAMAHIEQVWDALEDFEPETRKTALPTVIANDNISAIWALSRPARQSGQSFIRKTCELANRLENRGGPEIRLQWVSGKSTVLGSDIAHELAKNATTENLPPIRTTTLAYALRQVRNTIKPRPKGEHAIDSALPGKHTRLLYDNRKYREASLLCQLRTRHSRLNTDLARINVVETKECECGAGQEETARHFLFECRRWSEQRKHLLEIAGARWGDLSFFLGGRTEKKNASGELLDGPLKFWKPDAEVVNRTIQFALNTGRLM
jgi:Reverse transcriptase (RNA-dependent DNA polymerase)/Endonuclease-reverse transcriptase